eukprot:gene5571-biopygen16257
MPAPRPRHPSQKKMTCSPRHARAMPAPVSCDPWGNGIEALAHVMCSLEWGGGSAGGGIPIHPLGSEWMHTHAPTHPRPLWNALPRARSSLLRGHTTLSSTTTLINVIKTCRTPPVTFLRWKYSGRGRLAPGRAGGAPKRPRGRTAQAAGEEPAQTGPATPRSAGGPGPGSSMASSPDGRKPAAPDPETPPATTAPQPHDERKATERNAPSRSGGLPWSTPSQPVRNPLDRLARMHCAMPQVHPGISRRGKQYGRELGRGKVLDSPQPSVHGTCPVHPTSLALLALVPAVLLAVQCCPDRSPADRSRFPVSAAAARSTAASCCMVPVVHGSLLTTWEMCPCAFPPAFHLTFPPFRALTQRPTVRIECDGNAAPGLRGLYQRTRMLPEQEYGTCRVLGPRVQPRPPGRLAPTACAHRGTVLPNGKRAGPCKGFPLKHLSRVCLPCSVGRGWTMAGRPSAKARFAPSLFVHHAAAERSS